MNGAVPIVAMGVLNMVGSRKTWDTLGPKVGLWSPYPNISTKAVFGVRNGKDRRRLLFRCRATSLGSTCSPAQWQIAFLACLKIRIEKSRDHNGSDNLGARVLGGRWCRLQSAGMFS